MTTLSPFPQGLADESEYIRDTSLQAGQTVVNRYGDTAVELFLPELERGLFDGNWRIRYGARQSTVFSAVLDTVSVLCSGTSLNGTGKVVISVRCPDFILGQYIT